MLPLDWAAPGVIGGLYVEDDETVWLTVPGRPAVDAR